MTQSPLWTASDIAIATEGWLRGDFAVDGISIDSRTLRPNDLYVALKGRGNHDGHDFVDAAFQAGAAGVLISRDPVDHSVVVPDTFEGLQKLGVIARDRLSHAAQIIAITGSVGKTTCRALTAQAFAAFGKTHASEHSLNNHWGVPLSLARMPRDTDYGVFEVGMNHAGEITELVQQILPHIAIITTIEAAHLEFFSDGLEGIARAKAEIFASLAPGGAAVLNCDNSQFNLLVDEARRYGVTRVVTFGRDATADLRLISYDRLEQGGRVTAMLNGTEFSFSLPLRGEHHAMNALATLGAIYAAGLDVETAAASFATLDDVAGRGNSMALGIPAIGTITLIDDRHNSSPVALSAAIREFAHQPVTGRRIVALGDMLELGEQSPSLHAGIAPALLAAKIDSVLTCGPMMRHLADALPPTLVTHHVDAVALADNIASQLQDGDALLVKGSRGAQMIRVVDALNRLVQNQASVSG